MYPFILRKGSVLCLALLPMLASGGEPLPARSTRWQTANPPATDDGSPPPPSLEQRLTPEERQGIYRHLQIQSEINYGDHAEIENRRQMLRRRMQERLQQADTDNDNSVSRLEAEGSLPGIARHFDEIDLNHDGVITLDEFRAAEEIRRLMNEQAMNTETKPATEIPKEDASSQQGVKRPKARKSSKRKTDVVPKGT